MKRRTQEQKLEQEKGLIELGFRLLEPSLEPEAVGAEAAPSAAAALGGFLQQRWGKAGEYERLADEKRKQQEERERLAAAKRKQREQEQRERAVAEKRRLQELQDQRRSLREQKEAQKQAEEEGRRGAAASRLVAGGASPLVGLQVGADRGEEDALAHPTKGPPSIQGTDAWGRPPRSLPGRAPQAARGRAGARARPGATPRRPRPRQVRRPRRRPSAPPAPPQARPPGDRPGGRPRRVTPEAQAADRGLDRGPAAGAGPPASLGRRPRQRR